MHETARGRRHPAQPVGAAARRQRRCRYTGGAVRADVCRRRAALLPASTGSGSGRRPLRGRRRRCTGIAAGLAGAPAGLSGAQVRTRGRRRCRQTATLSAPGPATVPLGWRPVAESATNTYCHRPCESPPHASTDPRTTSHPMKKDFVIKILFVENSLEEAEQIISLLRNSGIAVRPARATNLEQLQAAVNELEPDVVMFDPAVTSLNLEEAMRVLEAYGRDFALIGLVGNMDNELVADLFVHGARGVATRSHPKQLIAVLKREFESLHTRRQVRWLHTALRETERRCDALLDSSTDAIAYVHEGMHVRANQAYLDTFGYESFDDLLGMPLLDMIDSANADEMKALLRGQAHQGKFPAQLPLRARRADDSRFDATVEFAPATFEGERCLQIVFRRQVVDPAVLEQLQRDPVTGLYNRQHMLACIDDAVTEAAKGKKGQSLLLIEPDNWASLVSGIGLGKTDELLAGFAGRIRMLLGATDIAGMLAEHTFGVALDSRSDEAIREWIAKLQHSVGSEIFDAGTRSLTVTASVGGSLLGE